MLEILPWPHSKITSPTALNTTQAGSALPGVNLYACCTAPHLTTQTTLQDVYTHRTNQASFTHSMPHTYAILLTRPLHCNLTFTFHFPFSTPKYITHSINHSTYRTVPLYSSNHSCLIYAWWSTDTSNSSIPCIRLYLQLASTSYNTLALGYSMLIRPSTF